MPMKKMNTNFFFLLRKTVSLHMMNWTTVNSSVWSDMPTDCQSCKEQSFDDAPAHDLYLIESGVFKASYSFIGDIGILDEFMVGEGGVKGIIITKFPKNATVTVDRDTVLCKSSVDTLRELKKKNLNLHLQKYLSVCYSRVRNTFNSSLFSIKSMIVIQDLQNTYPGQITITGFQRQH
jgi:hypothetical protein